ncbi:AMP-binding protein [Streptomyces sp. B6B3]|uniref:AMP-binding protein n=1 Tax=Streptomyces sp. B6B3 TaxID=3153570 RepID=UPI00325C6D95
MGIWETLVAPSPDQAASYRAQGAWRETTFLDDLAEAARLRGDHPAIIAYERRERVAELSYAGLAAKVERFASALAELGVGRGDVVAFYLPNRWMLTPLYLACQRVGAVVSPVIPALDVRELGFVLRESGARVCVTVDRFNDEDYGARLAEAAPDTLAHRVVVGDAAASGAIDFEEYFDRTPWEERHPLDPEAALGPDDPALLLYTSGTTGRRKGVVHTQNTLHAAVLAVTRPHLLGADDVISIPSFATHMAGLTYACYMPLLLHATCVVQDPSSDMELLLDIIATHGVTWAYATPAYLVGMIGAQRERPRDLSGLTQLVSGSAPIRPQLIAEVRDTLGVEVRALWGMTENGAVTVTRPDDPEGWGAHSDGRAEPFMELRIDTGDAAPRPGAEAAEGRLLVRGASQCLGYLGQREVYEACLDADGWFDTSDIARDDGRGGIRITGRSADQITRSTGLKVSTLEAESVLAVHPGVKEVCVVGAPDPRVPGAELVCAVVVPQGEEVPTLEDLRAHLAEEKVTELLWPDRLQFMWELPKNSLGKVLRHPLRERLEIEHAARR